MADLWVTAKTQSRRERWAAENVLKQGCEPYLPKFLEIAREKTPRGFVKVERAALLFPGYIFIRTSGQWRFLLGTYGIASVLVSGDRPSYMPPETIEKMKARQDSDGFIVLPQRPSYQIGDAVSIKSPGLLNGRSGIYAGEDARGREKILLDFLGRKTEFLLGEEDFLERVE